MSRNRFWYLAVLLCVLLGAATVFAASTTFVVDQENTELTYAYFYNIAYFAPVGQSFVPATDSLHVVELWISDASCSGQNPPGIRGWVQVHVHEASIFGPILATSEPFGFTNCYSAAAQFHFTLPVPLVPGNTYVLEPSYVSGNTSLVKFDMGSGLHYAAGGMYVYGVLDTSKDLWFREGNLLTVPTDRTDCMHGGWQNLTREDGSSFRNQGACIRYVMTGH